MTRTTLTALLAALALLALAGPTTAAPPALQGVYRADDGGEVYLRVVGSDAWAFAENAGKGYAFVLRGTVDGNRIKGSWWDVPKHARTTKGPVELRISPSGNRLTRTSGDAAIGVTTLNRVAPASVDWPKTDREAGFQSTALNDLDGKFVRADGTRFYLRESGGDVVGVGELRTGSDKRPTWVSVFTGTRTGKLTVAGKYSDVPKGTRTNNGNLGLAQLTGTRELSLAFTGTPPAGATARPDYAVDFAGMATRIKQAMRGGDGEYGVVGFGFVVTKDDRIVAEGAGGSRRLGQDDPSGNNKSLPFTVGTQNEAASTTKLVTAAMLIRTLEEKGISLDAKVAGALPSCWKRGPGIVNTAGGLTWKHLLSHTSMLTRPSACSDNPYECLRRAVAAGRVGEPGRKYQNINYTILRFMIPTLRNKAGVEAIFDKYGCKQSNGAKINAEVSEKFRKYVSDQVLAPLGIVGTFEPVGQYAIRYDFSQPRKKGLRPSYRDVLESGSGGMKWSSHEFGEFLAALETGKIVSPGMLRTMRSERLGYDSWYTGAAGKYPTKNGGAGGTKTRTVSFPSGIAAFITVNSDNNDESLAGLGDNLRAAFDKSIR